MEDEEAKRGPELQELSKQNTVLWEKVAVLEGFSHRQNICITGVKEGSKGQDVEGFIKTLLREAL